MLTVIILTRNEEVNIEKCIRSVKGASEIVVVDSFSTDRTAEIAKTLGATVVTRAFTTQADQLSWALENVPIKTEWILRLDADEEMLPELWAEMQATLPQAPANITGFYLPLRVYFMGRFIRHGAYYPLWLLRLWRKGKVRPESREVDERMMLLEGEYARLKNDFVDRNLKGLEFWIAKQNDHSSREVRARLDKNPGRLPARLFGSPAERRRWLKTRIFLRLPLFLRAFLFFIYRYIFRLGFLDGKEGLVFHFLSALWYPFLVDAKMYEAEKIRE